MTNFFQKLLLQNWKRKTISILLGVFIWFIVHHSLTSTRTIFNVSVRVVRLSPSKTIDGILSNGKIPKKINLTLVGNKATLDNLQPSDLEIVLDASDKPDEWLPTITKKNLTSLNPELDLINTVNKVSHSNFTIHLSNRVTEKIPIAVITPHGEAPRGYQFLDVWPYHLELSVSGPEETLKKVRNKEVKLAFDLGNITKKQLDTLAEEASSDTCNVVTFPIPDEWKSVHIPGISEDAFVINDPSAKGLHLSFIRCALLPVNHTIPLQFFYYPDDLETLNPKTVHVLASTPIKEQNEMFVIDTPLYAQGADQIFLDIVKNKMMISVLVSHKDHQRHLSWNVQFINPQELEDRYVRALTPETIDNDMALIQHSRQVEYLRNRFRSYMNRFRLYQPDGTKLVLSFELDYQNTLIASMVPPRLESSAEIAHTTLETTHALPSP